MNRFKKEYSEELKAQRIKDGEFFDYKIDGQAFGNVVQGEVLRDRAKGIMYNGIPIMRISSNKGGKSPSTFKRI